LTFFFALRIIFRKSEVSATTYLFIGACAPDTGEHSIYKFIIHEQKAIF